MQESFALHPAYRHQLSYASYVPNPTMLIDICLQAGRMLLQPPEGAYTLDGQVRQSGPGTFCSNHSCSMSSARERHAQLDRSSRDCKGPAASRWATCVISCGCTFMRSCYTCLHSVSHLGKMWPAKITECSFEKLIEAYSCKLLRMSRCNVCILQTGAPLAKFVQGKPHAGPQSSIQSLHCLSCTPAHSSWAMSSNWL